MMLQFKFSCILFVSLLCNVFLIQAADPVSEETTTEWDTSTIDSTDPSIEPGRRMLSSIQKRHFFMKPVVPVATIQPYPQNVHHILNNQLKTVTVTNVEAWKLLWRDVLQLFFFYDSPLTLKLLYIYQDVAYIISVLFETMRYFVDLIRFCLKFKGIIGGPLLLVMTFIRFIPSFLITVVKSLLGFRITVE